MGLPFVETLPDRQVYKCRCCKVDSASHDSIISKDFHGRHGRAYLFKKVYHGIYDPIISKNFHGRHGRANLFKKVVNISLGPEEDRHLMTGLHTVNDIYCSFCQQLLGWRYEKAYEEGQKYKEGKFILEKAMMVKEGW